MDPVTIIVILVALELATGGVSGAAGATVGAVADGAKAAAKEGAIGAKEWYAKREKELSKTRRGRARLAAEKRTVGAAKAGGRAVKAGAKAAPGGAKSGWSKGRQVRRDALAKVADGARHAKDVGAGKVADWRSRDNADDTVVPDAPPVPPMPPFGSYIPDEGPGGPDRLVPHDACDGKGCDVCGGDGEVPAWSQDPKHGVIPPLPAPAKTPFVHGVGMAYAGALMERARAGDQEAARELMRRAVAREQMLAVAQKTAPQDGDDMDPWTTATAKADAERAKTPPPNCRRCGTPYTRGATHYGADGGSSTDLRCDNCGLQSGEFRPWDAPDEDYGDDPEDVDSALGGVGSTSKGENVSSTFPTEKVGAEKYVPAWDTPGPTLELTMATISSLVEEMGASAEANSHHEVGGVQDVVGRGQVVVEALQAFGEAIAGHAVALHEEHDGSIEHARGKSAESLQEYLGAH